MAVKNGIISLLKQLIRNRFALSLLFILPVFLFFFTGLIMSKDVITVPIEVEKATKYIHANQTGLTFITMSFLSTAFAVGIMAYIAIRKTIETDVRLLLCGFSRISLMLSKLIGLMLMAVIVALWLTGLLSLFMRIDQPAAVLIGLLTIAINYSALGILLGVMVKQDLEGLFLVIMVGIIDTALPDPRNLPVIGKKWMLSYFPSHNPMNAVINGAFGANINLTDLFSSAGVSILLFLIALGILYWRTRKLATVV